MYFLVLGYDLVEWLMEFLDIEDSAEVLHLASQLCQHGYIFPVTDTKTLSVKDDGTLYRFQVREGGRGVKGRGGTWRVSYVNMDTYFR